MVRSETALFEAFTTLARVYLDQGSDEHYLYLLKTQSALCDALINGIPLTNPVTPTP